MKQNGLPISVGIIGGGQLAQMLALASRSVGVRPFVLAQRAGDCALQVTQDYILDDGSDSALENFFTKVDVITIENEFIDLDRFERVLGEKFKSKILPCVDTLRLVQSKLDQKKFLKKNKIPTLEFFSVQGAADFDRAWEYFGGHFVIKQARLGYDGRGTFIFGGKKDRPKFDTFRDQPGKDFFGYAEPLAHFKKELSVVVARSSRGEIKSYSTFETFQRDGVCQWALNPAQVSPKQNKTAQNIAKKVVQKLNGVGVFAIEMFLLKNGEIVVNEIAPRVHNSGHLTQNACLTSQFEQHLRAILGFPFGAMELISPSAMVNIIGVKEEAQTQLAKPIVGEGLWLHWYGKTGFSRNRKLGHINAVGISVKEALKRAQAARKSVLV